MDGMEREFVFSFFLFPPFSCFFPILSFPPPLFLFFFFPSYSKKKVVWGKEKRCLSMHAGGNMFSILTVGFSRVSDPDKQKPCRCRCRTASQNKKVFDENGGFDWGGLKAQRKVRVAFNSECNPNPFFCFFLLFPNPHPQSSFLLSFLSPHYPPTPPKTTPSRILPISNSAYRVESNPPISVVPHTYYRTLHQSTDRQTAFLACGASKVPVDAWLTPPPPHSPKTPLSQILPSSNSACRAESNPPIGVVPHTYDHTLHQSTDRPLS